MNQEIKLKKSIQRTILIEVRTVTMTNVICLLLIEFNLFMYEFSNFLIKYSMIGVILPLLMYWISTFFRRDVVVKECKNLCIKEMRILYLPIGLWVSYKTLDGKKVKRFFREPSRQEKIAECEIKSDEICYIYKLKSMNMLLGYNEKGRAWCEKYTE